MTRGWAGGRPARADGGSVPARRRCALERIAAAEAPEEFRRARALPPLVTYLGMRIRAGVRRLRLSFELCNVSTLELETIAVRGGPKLPRELGVDAAGACGPRSVGAPWGPRERAR